MAVHVTKPDAKQTYVCIVGHASTAGSYAAGATFRGNHPGPQAAPIYWAPTGLADDELAALLIERGLAGFPH